MGKGMTDMLRLSRKKLSKNCLQFRNAANEIDNVIRPMNPQTVALIIWKVDRSMTKWESLTKLARKLLPRASDAAYMWLIDERTYPKTQRRAISEI